MSERWPSQERWKSGPYLDRHSDEDRRQSYDLDHFSDGVSERRSGNERPQNKERRKDCVKVAKWSSFCPKESTTNSDEGG